MDDDALDHVEVSTEEIAERESQESARADADQASQGDRRDEGRFHSRSLGDRDETGSA